MQCVSSTYLNPDNNAIVKNSEMKGNTTPQGIEIVAVFKKMHFRYFHQLRSELTKTYFRLVTNKDGQQIYFTKHT